MPCAYKVDGPHDPKPRLTRVTITTITPMHIMNALLLSTALRAAAAALADCGSRWPLQTYSVDPPASVGSGQPVTLTATFTVPDSQPPLSAGNLQLQSTAMLLFSEETQLPLCDYLPCPLKPGTHTLSWSGPFPEGVTGRIQTTLRFEDRLCLRWTAHATGRASNETNRFNHWLYS